MLVQGGSASQWYCSRHCDAASCCCLSRPPTAAYACAPTAASACCTCCYICMSAITAAYACCTYCCTCMLHLLLLMHVCNYCCICMMHKSTAPLAHGTEQPLNAWDSACRCVHVILLALMQCSNASKLKQNISHCTIFFVSLVSICGKWEDHNTSHAASKATMVFILPSKQDSQ